MAPAPFNEFGLVRRPTVASVTSENAEPNDSSADI